MQLPRTLPYRRIARLSPSVTASFFAYTCLRHQYSSISDLCVDSLDSHSGMRRTCSSDSLTNRIQHLRAHVLPSGAKRGRWLRQRHCIASLLSTRRSRTGDGVEISIEPGQGGEERTKSTTSSLTSEYQPLNPKTSLAMFTTCHASMYLRGSGTRVRESPREETKALYARELVPPSSWPRHDVVR